METRALRLALLALLALLGLGPAWSVSGQGMATVETEENLRSEAQGVILGRVHPGVALSVVSREVQWVQVQLEGWIWTRSLQATDRLGFDLVVSESPAENLRSEPSGEIMARLVTGTLLDRLEQIPGWTRIRRTAWIWAGSVDLTEDVTPTAVTRPNMAQAVATPPGSGEAEWWRGRAGGSPVLSGPDGDTLAIARPGADLRILAREGSWIRVRLEGWSWAPEGEGADSLNSELAVNPSPAQVSQDPQLYRGKTVTWELQFISLEQAEKIRTDFYEDEPFLLTRTASGGSTFVYVAVARDRLSEVQGLVPLERIRVVGRLRTGAAALTGNPILDLLEITRLSRD